ncbi:filamentous hemagglutinin N-terminal domain-containing protein [Yersinia enterocolitica]|uniref:two-partner secretion domain-containing protein n=1 Tax=Yersinia enterocolitica TaxID=630 RepID=UPI001C8DEAE0|nr:filamentous hemagglutinin N-terminal domain-containing protein [Yersinia enterocolitica]MBX9479419.1 filamentous hemagglutinin N-terminal domain-containing protein [Yersinia enterocolitica]
MNSKLYKLIFCRRLGCLIAVGEFTRTYGRSFSSFSKKIINDNHTRAGELSHLAILTGLVFGTLSLRVFAHPSLPLNGNIVFGQGEMSVNNTTLTVTQQSDKLAINWGSFDIAQGSSVIYNQPGQQSIALNRVLGHDTSQIYGNLKANGQVFLLNPNGILFGKGAQVDVGGLVASTKSMSNHDFISGCYTLTSQKQEGKLVNQANLRTTAGGYIALIGQHVDNQPSGVINTPQGKVAFTSGSQVTLNLDHSNLLGVQVQGEQVSTLLQNGGLIQADGGVIQLTAHGKEMLMNTVIDNSGILQAHSLSEKNGVIYLNGGTQGVVSQQGVINVSSLKERGGNVILIGENIHLVATSIIDARGAEGGGKVLVGGGRQGKNRLIKNARSVVMDKGANIDVSSSNRGAGGTAVVWSENYTGFYGDIHARGGPLSGDGGQVETSSKSNLQVFGRVDTSAIMGNMGGWLLDPAEVNIVGSDAESGVSLQIGDIPVGYAKNAQVFTPMANITQILNTSINAQLDKGTNVTITTSNGHLTNCRWCNITLQADINKIAGGNATLTLQADGNIVSGGHNITVTAGKLNLNLLSGDSIVDSKITLNNSDVLLNGGDLQVKHANKNNIASISIMGGRYQVGNLTLEGNSGLASQVGVNISNAANITVAGETRITGKSSNANQQGWRGIDISGDSVLTGKGNMSFAMTSNSKSSWMGTFTNATIVGDENITFQANANGSTSGGVDFTNGSLVSKFGNISFDINGEITTQTSFGLRIQDSQVSGNNVNVEIKSTGANGFLLRDSHVTATAGNIKAGVISSNNGVFIGQNATLNAHKDLVLVAESLTTREAIIVQGLSDGSRNHLVAQGNVSLKGSNSNGSNPRSSVNLANVSLTSIGKNIDITSSSAGDGDVYLNNVDLNAALGNVTVYGEALSALSTATNSALSLGGNNSIKALNGLLIGKAINTTQGVGALFRANGSLSVEGNVAIQGETGGTGETRNGIAFYGANTLNIAKDSQLSLLGENTSSQITADGNGISYLSPKTLTINNNGSLTMEGRSTSGTGINFSISDNTVVLNGEGDSLIKGGSVASSGVAISGVVNNSSGPVTIEGTSTDGTGVHLFSAEHQINRINVTGSSIQAEGLRISGNASITDTVLTGKSINGSGIKVDSLPGSGVISYTVLDNAALNGSSTHGIGVETTSDINGIHQSMINGTTDGIGHGIDIAENLHVTGTSEMDLLTLQGTATTGSGTGIKLNGNNDLSNTSLNGSTVDGIALDISGSLTNSGNTRLNGTASGDGIGVQVNGTLNNSVVNGTSASGVGVQVSGSLDDSHVTGVSSGGSGVKVGAETVLNNTMLKGTSTDGIGVEIIANMSGYYGSSVQGDVTDGTGVMIGRNTILAGGDTDDLLVINGNATGDQGGGIQLYGNNTLANTTLAGNATEGVGIDIDGPLINKSNSTLDGKATDGDGVQLNGAIVGGTVNGTSDNGSGIKVDGDSELDKAMLNGNSPDGKGIEIAANLTGNHGSAVHGETTDGTGVDIGSNATLTGGGADDQLAVTGDARSYTGSGIQLNGNNTLDNTTLAGSATEGVGIDIDGPLTNKGNSTLDGKATDDGYGVQLNGAISGGTVNGTSDLGSGIKVDGDSELDNATLNGNSSDGKGIEIAANLTGNHGSAVHGESDEGIGVDIGPNATLTGGGADDLLAVTGNASGDIGTGVQLDGNNTLDNTTLAGNATDGHGVKITGPVSNTGNTTINGNATGDGHGIHINGPMSGGSVNGNSANNHGIFLNDKAVIAEMALGGNTGSDKPLMFIALPENIGSNATINGKPVDKHSPDGRTKPDPTSTSTSTPTQISTPTPTSAQTPTPTATPIPTLISEGKTLSKQITQPQKESKLGSLLIKRNQILSSLDEQILPPPVVTESERDIAANISVAVCIPESVTTGSEPCDTHILGKWKPLTKTLGQE